MVSAVFCASPGQFFLVNLNAEDLREFGGRKMSTMKAGYTETRNGSCELTKQGV